MRILFILILIQLTTGISSFSQEVMKPIKWVIRPSVGVNFPLTTLSGGYITDNLVGFNGNTYYGQFISSTYFFNHWGIEFSLAAYYSSKLTGRFDRFKGVVENKYSGNYFITTNTGGYSESNLVIGNIEKGSMGPVYKIEKNRWIMIGRAMIGVTSFDTNWGSVSLKGKGTNELIDIDWDTGKPVKDFFTFNPSFTLGYRVFNRVVLDFDLNYRIYDINFNYTETIQNMNTQVIETQNYSYSSLINELSLGFGLMIVLK